MRNHHNNDNGELFLIIILYDSMNMKIITLLIGLLISSSSIANEESNWLKEHNPNGYFPVNADYLNFQNICNKKTCFTVVAVSYVTSTNKGMRRVAVFSNSGVYIGVYSGFQDLPIKVSGSNLVFPKSEFGYIINFNKIQPPAMVYIDGEHFEFETQS